MISCAGLRLDDLRDPAYPALKQWAENSALAMLNSAAKEGRDLSPALLFGPNPPIRTAEISFSRRNPDGSDTTVDSPLADYATAREHAGDAFVLIRLRDLERLSQNGKPVGALSRAAALRRLNMLVSLLTQSPNAQPTDTFLVAPPIQNPKSKIQNLTPVLASGPDFPPGLLVSATTRTPGLVSNLDFAPTLSALLRVPVANQNMGRVLRVVKKDDGAERIANAARIDYLAELNGRALWPVTAGLFGLCAVLITAGFAARKRNPLLARVFAPALVFAQNVGAAALLAPLLVPPTLLEYGLRIAAWMLALTVGCYALARIFRLPPPLWAALITLLLLAGDGATGQNLLKDSLLSDYALAGIRYYGIGNEYLGAALGFAIAGGSAWLDSAPIPFPPNEKIRARRIVLLTGWLGLTLLFGWPDLGANAGSLVACGAGFAVSAALLFGKPANWKIGVPGALVGAGAAFAFSVWDARQSGGQASHLGAVVQTAGKSGLGYPAMIALRKVAMNFRLLISPGFLLAAGGGGGIIYASRKLFGAEWRALFSRRPWLAQSRKALLSAATASLLFKDSGVVTALFLTVSAWLIFAWFLLTEGSEAYKMPR